MSRTMKALKPLLLVILFYTIFLSGCATENDGELLKGTCKVDVKGFVNNSFYGEAIFDDVPTGHEYNIFFMYLKDAKIKEPNYRYIEISGSKPIAGTYNIYSSNDENNRSNVMFVYYGDSEANQNFITSGGSFVISWVNEDSMKGGLEFTAYANINSDGGESKRVEIKVNAIFYAQKGNTGVIIN